MGERTQVGGQVYVSFDDWTVTVDSQILPIVEAVGEDGELLDQETIRDYAQNVRVTTAPNVEGRGLILTLKKGGRLN